MLEADRGQCSALIYTPDRLRLNRMDCHRRPQRVRPCQAASDGDELKRQEMAQRNNWSTVVIARRRKRKTGECLTFRKARKRVQNTRKELCNQGRAIPGEAIV